MPSLPPADRVQTTRRSRRHRGGLSRRQAKKLARVGQLWQHSDIGDLWRVKQLHRADEERRAGPLPSQLAPVVLERPGQGLRYLTFGELGSSYRLIEDAGEGE